MTTFTVTPTLAPAFTSRVLDAAFRFFTRAAVARESMDQAWFDSGLHRLDAATLEDIGAPPAVAEAASLREAWKLAASIDAVRHL
jgi:hypothetical protein